MKTAGVTSEQIAKYPSQSLLNWQKSLRSYSVTKKEPTITPPIGYEHWFERFKRVLYASKQGMITVEDLKKFQIFLLDIGQFNANFDLEELNYLHYPKSPFAIMHDKFYLREVETWAMQMLRFQYQERYANFGQLFPIFVDSDLFWKELERYYRVIKASDISDDSVLGVLDEVEASNEVSVWIEVDTPNGDTDASERKELAQKAVEQKLVELTLKKQNIPDVLIPLFIAIHDQKQIIAVQNESIVLKHLEQFASQVNKNLRENFENLREKLNVAVLNPEKLKESINLIFAQCRKYKILPQDAKTLPKFKKLSSENLEATKQLTVELMEVLSPQESTVDSYRNVIEAWNRQNIPALPSDIVYYFKDRFNSIEIIVLCDEDNNHLEDSDFFVYRAIEHLGYRIEPVRIQHIILESYPRLFVDAEQTRKFWIEFSKTSMITGLDPDEQEVIENPALSKLKLLELKAINQLQQRVFKQIQSIPLPVLSKHFAVEMRKLYEILPSLSRSFEFYAKYLKDYLEDYLHQYHHQHALRFVVDSEIKHTLNIFFNACTEENLSNAIRAVQSISEIMLLDLSLKPLELSQQLPLTVRTQLADLPVQGTLVVPYGMRAFVRVFQILDAKYKSGHLNGGLNIFATSQSYYEWLANLESLNGNQVSVLQIQQATDTSPSADIIFVELHPNNVMASKQFAFNIGTLLYQMNNWPPKQRTLVIDMTLNAMNDQEIQSFLRSESALGLINDGALNIILIQSLTKFAQLGLDKRSAGTLTMINNNKYWSEVNIKLVELSNVEHVDISTLSFFSYFANMHWPEVEYLELINRNVRFVYQEIVEQTNKLELLHSGLQVSSSSDPKPCYVAINTNGFITDFSLTSDDFRKFTSDFLRHLFYPLCQFYELPITERYSIGFPLTSINPVFGSLRLTIGLEPEAQLKQYAEILAYTTFIFNDLRDECKLPLVQNKSLRREFLAEKVKIFKAMTPGRDERCEWEYDGSAIWRDRPLKRKVILKDGEVHFYAEIPGRFLPEWTKLPATVIMRGIGEISINDSRMTIAEKRIVAGCYTAEYNVLILDSKIAHLANYEVLGPWNAKSLYGPFYHNGAELFCVLYQKKVSFYYNRQRFNEEDVIVKQGTIETTLSDMAIGDRAFLVREGYGYTLDRSIPSITGHNRFDFQMQFIPPSDKLTMQFSLRGHNRFDFQMQFIPPSDKLTMQFSLRGNKLVIEHDFLCCAASGVTVYYRILGDQLTCYEIDYWAEKDPVAARFLRFITAAYVKELLSGTSFKASNSQLTHFIFNLNHEVGAALLQEAISIITFYKESIKKALQSITLDDQQYHFYDSNSFSSRQVSWPSGYSSSGADYVSNAAFIKKTLGQFDKFKIFKTHKIQSEQPIPDILTIKGDGDCIYNSILAGIKRLPDGINIDIILLDNIHIDLNTLNLAQLRGIVADYIEAHQGYYFDLIAFQIADNIRHNELAGYPKSMRDEMQILANAYHSKQNIQAVEHNIQQFINNGIVGQYINLMRNTYDSGQEVIWGGAVELGIISEILGIQFYVYRRGGEYYHIDNTQTDNAHRVDLDYTGDHYNLILLPTMLVDSNQVTGELLELPYFNNEEEKDMSGEGILRLKKEYQEISHIYPFYNKYYKYGLEEILLLRLRDANIKDATILPAFKLNVQTLKSVLPLVATEFDKGFNEVIVPCNIEKKHWVGLIFKINVDDNIDIVYLDSEQAGLTLDLEIQLIKHFKERGQEVVITEEEVELQRYNNCGPELVENVVKHLGGTRVGQDESVMLHSTLYERAIMQTSQLEVVNHDALQVATQMITCEGDKEESVLVTDINSQQIIDEESSTIFTDLTHIKSELLSAQRQQILTESRVSRINREEVDIDRNTKKVINIEVDGTWYSEFNIREYLKEINDKLEGYIVSWISPDRYKSMEGLASKYGIKVKIKDEKGLEKAYKKLSLKTHPDKTIRLEEEAKIEAEVDFKKATEIKEGREGNFNIAETIYTPIMNVVRKANLGIKVVDVSIEIVRTTYDPTIGNIIKATTGVVTSSALYLGKSGVIKVTLPIEIGYKVYEEDYTGAINSGISGMATTLAYGAVCATMPVLCMPITVGLTVYSGYNVLENGYKLYNELFAEEFLLESWSEVN